MFRQSRRRRKRPHRSVGGDRGKEERGSGPRFAEAWDGAGSGSTPSGKEKKKKRDGERRRKRDNARGFGTAEGFERTKLEKAGCRRGEVQREAGEGGGRGERRREKEQRGKARGPRAGRRKGRREKMEQTAPEQKGKKKEKKRQQKATNVEKEKKRKSGQRASTAKYAENATVIQIRSEGLYVKSRDILGMGCCSLVH